MSDQRILSVEMRNSDRGRPAFSYADRVEALERERDELRNQVVALELAVSGTKALLIEKTQLSAAVKSLTEEVVSVGEQNAALRAALEIVRRTMIGLQDPVLEPAIQTASLALLGEEAPRLSAEECELRGMKGLAELAGGEEDRKP